MAEVTSSDTVKQPIPIVIKVPGACLTVEFDGEGQADLEALAALGQGTLDAAFAFIANMNARSATIVADGLQQLLASLVALSTRNDLLQSLPRMQIMLDGLNEIQRFAEGPFSDPRIEAFDQDTAGQIDHDDNACSPRSVNLVAYVEPGDDVPDWSVKKLRSKFPRCTNNQHPLPQ
ncbi:MAG: hypothetical protein WBP12_04425 [Candidatus Saccharimonas sp.]